MLHAFCRRLSSELNLRQSSLHWEMCCPQMTLISCRDRGSWVEKVLVKSASANACTFLAYLEVEVFREEDAEGGPKELNRHTG